MPDFKGFVRHQLSSVALPRDRELKIVEELAAQIEESYESLIAEGVSDEEAWREVQRHIPDWKTFGDELLDAEPVIVRLAQPDRGPLAGETKRGLLSRLHAFFGLGVVRDIRSSVRRLLKTRGFTATTVLTLAVCLGANAAIFTVIHAVLLRPLPVPDPDRIVALGDVYPTITPKDVSPALGRTFTDAEGEPGAQQRIILSHGLWLRLYGGDPAGDRPHPAAGLDRAALHHRRRDAARVHVLRHGRRRARARGGEPIEFWIPLAFTEAQKSDAARTRYGFFHIGRLRPGATVARVRAQVDALNPANFARFPALGLAALHMYTAVTPLQEALTRGVSRTLYLLWGGVAFVLLIGTLNIANLALARASARSRELTTRLALGAGRFRVTRQPDQHADRRRLPQSADAAN